MEDVPKPEPLDSLEQGDRHTLRKIGAHTNFNTTTDVEIQLLVEFDTTVHVDKTKSNDTALEESTRSQRLRA